MHIIVAIIICLLIISVLRCQYIIYICPAEIYNYAICLASVASYYPGLPMFFSVCEKHREGLVDLVM